MSPAGAAARRFRLASPATALLLGVLVLAAGAASAALARLAHQSVTSGGTLVLGVSFGVVGLVLAWKRSLRSPVAVAAATLAAVALFSPLRRRTQRAVDRRFNRARYDADRTITAFAARLADATDLDTLRADLLGVIHQSLEPAHVSVWVRRADQ